MSLSKLKDSYLNKNITKDKYIEKMFSVHKHLFDYSEFIKNTDIEKIEITSGSVVMSTKDKIKFLCEKNDRRIAPVEILNFGSYEKEETEMSLLLIEKGFCIFDIGANFGWYSLFFSKHVKNAKIFSFEPVKNTFNYLNRNITLNKVQNIKTFNFGFSDKEEEKILYVRKSESGIASMVNLKEDKNAKKIICRFSTLDNFVMEKNLKVDFIKCDVEGAELLVLKGGKNIISKYKPIIFAEMLRKWSAKFGYAPKEIIYLLKEFGYQCYTLKNGRLKKFSKMRDNTIQTNFFFLHTKKHSAKIKELED
jgi:FkbM family methyltransferase